MEIVVKRASKTRDMNWDSLDGVFKAYKFQAKSFNEKLCRERDRVVLTKFVELLTELRGQVQVWSFIKSRRGTEATARD
jgi:hypothetical protein